jgi:hypothetical protein
MDRDDWMRGTYGSPEVERGQSYGRGREFGPERRPPWSRPDWPREPWRGDRDQARPPQTERSDWGQNWWRQQHWHGRTSMRGYQRSDERIREDVCERLCEHPSIDTAQMDVRVENGEVTLEGTVDDRWEKRLAEDVAEAVPGVRDVHNRLRTSTSTGGAAASVSGGSLSHGMAVVGIDGDEIGRVKEVGQNEFLLDRPMGRDLYVPMRYVQNTLNDRVVLTIPGSQIDKTDWRSPELVQTPPPVTGTMRG